MKPFPKNFFPLLWMYLKTFKWQVVTFVSLMLLGSVSYNLNIRLFSEIIGAIKLDNPNSFQNALTFVYWFVGCSFAAIIAEHYAKYFTDTHFLVPFKSRMEKDLFSYLLGHSYEFITSRQSGMLIAQKNDVKQLPEILSSFTWDLAAIFDILVKTVLLALISPLLGIGYLALGVMVIFPGRHFSKMLAKANKISAKTSAIVSGRILDTVNNLELVKQFDNIEYEKQRLKPLWKQEYDNTVRAFVIFFKQFTVIGVAVSVSSFLLLVSAVYFWSRGEVTTADIVFILITLTGGLNQIAMLFDNMQNHRAQMAKIEQGLEPFAIAHGIVDMKNAKALKVKKGEIEFSDVTFAYAGKRKPVLKNFNLTIHPHEKVGIVGESGSGKTTLINLLQRAYEIKSGSILIDGQNISAVTQESLHQNISLIPQDTVMFNRSIAENIAFGVPNTRISIRQVKEAAQKAYADDFIMAKENNYESFAGDRGCQLSGGERQRIAIARAILKKAPILILDEATSALDSESEQIINKAIANVIRNQTVIAIAHRLSTLKNMDRILVMHKGEIIEEGTFNELIAKGGKFAKLYFAEQKKHGGKNVSD